MTIDKTFVVENLLNKKGNLNPRALQHFNITKEQAYQVFHEMSGPMLCKTCSKPTSLISFNKGYSTFCSASCSSSHPTTLEKRMKSVYDRYGEIGLKDPSVTEKKKETSRKNFGTDWARQSTEYLDQLKRSWMETHGVTSFSHTDDAIQKRNKTNLKKYGFVNPVQNELVQEKIKKTNLDRYDVPTALMLNSNKKKALDVRRSDEAYSLLNNKSWLEEHKNVSSVTLSESLGIAWSTILNYFKKHNIERDSSIVSNTECKIQNILDEIKVTYEKNNRTILEGKEIDIFIPEKNIGIEINGIYWHSDKFIDNSHYHLNKTLMAKSKSVQLIHITNNEIDYKFDIVKNRLLNKLGLGQKIYARKCNVVEISNHTYTSYITKNHIQGYAPASVRLALMYENEIQAVMSFSKSRYNKKYEWELIRYASEHTVIGGAGKLFKYFVNKFDPISIISYADLRWNNGEMYNKIGMVYSHTSLPNYWYVIDNNLIHRSAFQKHKLKNKLKKYDPNKTEWENMKMNNIYKFWDCGNNVYTWRASQ